MFCLEKHVGYMMQERGNHCELYLPSAHSVTRKTMLGLENHVGHTLQERGNHLMVGSTCPLSHWFGLEKHVGHMMQERGNHL